MAEGLRLGLNIDHVATIRNARGGAHPDPARAAAMAYEAGADGLTIHLREDRRHIRDGDLDAIRLASPLPINLEMAATEEMCAIATAFKPHAACIVPEKREERTTEGGLDVAGQHNMIAPIVRELAKAGSRVSLFIEPDPVQIAVSEVIGAPVVELHTGRYAELWLEGDQAGLNAEVERLRAAAREARARGLEPHAGHGLTYDNVKPIAAIPEIAELNIGHFLIGEAIFTGLPSAVQRMRALMDEARNEAAA
jgi:pyridoxine 5-phosphate synthase